MMTYKPNRSLSEIAREIHRLDRHSIFTVGELLLEAKEKCEHGEWLEWLSDEFGMSEDSAERRMAAAKLVDKFRILRNLNLGKTVIYELTSYLDEPDLARSMVEALEAALATSGGRIAATHALSLIESVKLRREHGEDLPAATLHAIDSIGWQVAVAAWPKSSIPTIVDALKTEKPETKEDAQRIVDTAHYERVNGLFEGRLPREMPLHILRYYERMGKIRRRKIVQRLAALSNPATIEDVDAAYAAVVASPSPRGRPEPAEPEPAATLPHELVGAIGIVLEHARRPMPEAAGDAFTAGELAEAAQYLSDLERLADGEKKFRAIDRIVERAEAASKARAASA